MGSLNNKQRRPTHPGRLIREIILPELEITQAEFADKLGVSRRAIAELIHERLPLTPDMADRLSHFVGRSANAWLKMQQAVDLWEIERINVKKYANIKRKHQSDKRKAS